ncbi:MAG: Fic/DOC family N-terminal domain-containing protein [Solirubrobacterales bacterium]
MSGLAFLPAPLPRDLSLSTNTWNAVNRATGALARLDGTGQLIPAPALLRRPTLRLEAQSTSALEGTYAPFVDVLAADAEDQRALSAEMREVLNFETVAEMAFAWPEDRRVTVSMLGALQKRLVRGTASELSDSGGIRDRFVVIGSPGQGLDNARFIPPPPGDQLRAGFENLLGWVSSTPEFPAVVIAAMTHYQFETLHPFSDGNGRLGRLFVIVQLIRGWTIREPLLVVSPWFEARRQEYQDRLLDLSCTGDWDPWIRFFSEGVAESALESRNKVERLLEIREQFVESVQASGKRGTAERLAADLIGTPFLTVRDVAERYDVSQPAARDAVLSLCKIGVLGTSELRAAYNAQLYVAREVLGVLRS